MEDVKLKLEAEFKMLESILARRDLINKTALLQPPKPLMQPEPETGFVGNVIKTLEKRVLELVHHDNPAQIRQVETLASGLSYLSIKRRSAPSVVVRAATAVAPKFTTLKPLGDRLLVKLKKVEGKTASRILLPSTAQSKPQGGEVVAAGETKSLGKKQVPLSVKMSKVLGRLQPLPYYIAEIRIIISRENQPECITFGLVLKHGNADVRWNEFKDFIATNCLNCVDKKGLDVSELSGCFVENGTIQHVYSEEGFTELLACAVRSRQPIYFLVCQPDGSPQDVDRKGAKKRKASYQSNYIKKKKDGITRKAEEKKTHQASAGNDNDHSISDGHDRERGTDDEDINSDSAVSTEHTDSYSLLLQGSADNHTRMSLTQEDLKSFNIQNFSNVLGYNMPELPIVTARSDLVEEGPDLLKRDIGKSLKKLLRLFFSSKCRYIFDDNSIALINAKTMACTKGNQWLEDEVINAYANCLNKRQEIMENKFPKSFSFQTDIHQKIHYNSYMEDAVHYCKRRIKKPIYNFELVMMPINLTNKHWILASIHPKEEEIHIYDSLPKACFEDSTKKAGRDIVDFWNMYTGSDSWRYSVVEKLPTQRNDYDCGVFVLKYMDFLARGCSLDFTGVDCRVFRKKIPLEILFTHILYKTTKAVKLSCLASGDIASSDTT